MKYLVAALVGAAILHWIQEYREATRLAKLQIRSEKQKGLRLVEDQLSDWDPEPDKDTA